MLTPTINTERLTLRRYVTSDLDALYEIITDQRLQKYIKFPNLTREEELDYINKSILNADTDKCEKWAIVYNETNEVVGTISVNSVNSKPNYCNVGYVTRFSEWGKGFATEALIAVTKHLLEEGYYLVEASCNELNAPSIRVMEKAGYIKDGRIEGRRLNDDGTYSAVVFYSKK